MGNIIERNVFMAFGAWAIVIYDKADPTAPLWQVALGLTIGAVLFCLMAWSRGVDL